MTSLLADAQYEFAVQTLLGRDATKETILESLYRLRSTQPDDRIIVYFAGHGYTITDNFGHESGYLAAFDTESDREFTALSLNEVTSFRRYARAKHILFIFDTCFSGQALGLTRTRNISFEKFLTRRAYQVISAGAGDQTVSDFRSMTRLLLEELRNEEVDPITNLYTLGNLALHVQKRMSADSNQTQIPQFGHLRGSQGGDFVFRMAEDVGAHNKGPSQPGSETTNHDRPAYETLESDLKALQAFRRIMELDPDIDDVRIGIVERNLRLGREDQAAWELDEYLLYLLDAGQGRKAMELLEKLVRRHPENEEVRRRLAEAYRGAERHSDAITHYDVLIKLQIDRGRMIEAISSITEILSLDPPNPPYYEELIKNLRERGKRPDHGS